VSVRIVETGQFTQRQGVVGDVVKQVLEQMRAAGVLRYAHTSAVASRGGPVHYAAAPAPGAEVSELGDYASLLGEAEGRDAREKFTSNLAAMAAAPMAAKAAVAEAHSKIRGSKKFG